MLDGPRVERLLSVVRWSGAFLVLVVGPYVPNLGFQWVMLFGAYLVMLGLILWLLSRLAHAIAGGRSLVAHVAMAGDALAALAGLTVFAPNPQWGLTAPAGVVLIGTGALRGGRGGSIATFAATAVGYLMSEALRVDVADIADVTRAAVTLASFAFAAVVFMGWDMEVRRVVGDRARVASRLVLVERIATDVMYEWDITTGALTLSDAVATQLGYEPGRVERSWWEERLHPDDAGPVRDALTRLLAGKEREWEVDYRFRKADGTYTTVHDRAYVVAGGRRHRLVRMVGSLINVDSVSLYDRVTHMAGRALFNDRVERRAVQQATRSEPFAVLVADVEGSRELSAKVGAERIDEVLAELARRVEEHLGDGETIARIAHDQIALLFRATSADDVVARAAQIREVARVPFGGASNVRIDVVMGAAIYKAGEGDVVRLAAAALADAKRTHRHVAVYEPGGERRWDRRVELRDDLRGALTRGELCLRFQPIVDAATGACAAVEAFVRWAHPERGEIDAGDLLDVASDLELRAAVDQWVVHEAIRSLARMRRVAHDLRVSVNVSAASIGSETAASVRAALAAAQLPSDALTLDAPEDPALESGDAAQAVRDLRAIGVGIAIDDFGTGYASLLRSVLPATEVKIDRAFTARAARDEVAARIVASTIRRAHEAGIRAVAEGVEDKETLACVGTMGVDLIQGTAIARAMPFEEVIRWIAPAAQERAATVRLGRRGWYEQSDRLDKGVVLRREHAIG
ncbi:MAG: EAL domain-containing protein [Chloroflexota bacterium]|nr:EAL domain-containing protein [Chloroflexota bacterium]